MLPLRKSWRASLRRFLRWNRWCFSLRASLIATKPPMSGRVKSAIQAAGFYANWYPRQWLSPFGVVSSDGFHPVLAQHMRFAANASHRLARHLFHAMAGHGPKLEREQVLLGRFVDIGTEIFAIATSCARAQSMLRTDEQAKIDLLALVDSFCPTGRVRIERLFYGLGHNVDRQGYKLAQTVLSGELGWLESGIVSDFR